MADMTREKTRKLTREEAIARVSDILNWRYEYGVYDVALRFARSDMEKIEKYEQAIEKMLAEINTPNRGTCDYYIVDQIETIINELRKEVL